jgi:hypothetical protein
MIFATPRLRSRCVSSSVALLRRYQPFLLTQP